MALAKNLTGPTMGRMAPAMAPPVPVMARPFSAVAMPIQYQPSRRLVMTGRMAPIALDPPSVDIPPPPLGKLIFSTFPAAYKVRVAPQDPVGQIFPAGYS